MDTIKKEEILKQPIVVTNKIKKKKKKKKKTNRCLICNKKLGLCPIICRCNNMYCGLHITPNDHCCTYDYQTAGQKLLEKQLISAKHIDTKNLASC